MSSKKGQSKYHKCTNEIEIKGLDYSKKGNELK